MNSTQFNRRTLLRQIAKRNRRAAIVSQPAEQKFDDDLERFLNTLDTEVQANIDQDVARFATAATDAYDAIWIDLEDERSVTEPELSDVTQAIMAGMGRLLEDINAV